MPNNKVLLQVACWEVFFLCAVFLLDVTDIALVSSSVSQSRMADKC